jgi:hypothetical protein
VLPGPGWYRSQLVYSRAWAGDLVPSMLARAPVVGSQGSKDKAQGWEVDDDADSVSGLHRSRSMALPLAMRDYNAWDSTKRRAGNRKLAGRWVVDGEKKTWQPVNSAVGTGREQVVYHVGFERDVLDL